MAKVDISKMIEDEFRLYDLIHRRYLAQFLPVSETDKTQIVLTCGQHTLMTRGNVLIAPGWIVLFGKTLEDEEDSKQALPVLTLGQTCQVIGSEMKAQQTTPPSHFTEGTLLTAMKNATRFVMDERLKQCLRATEGLGTEATRAATIQGLIDKGFLKKKGKSLLAINEVI